MISSAYKLCAKMIADEFPPSEWNIYPFHFSDGDNWSVDDTVQCIEILQDPDPAAREPVLLRAGREPLRLGPVHQGSDEHFDEDDRVVVSEIKGKDAIMDSIRDFLGKGK
jgi:uncharacterized sporulation protein YeaH/YhbH (DUF444 family)